jgi:hypothetical protein
MFCIHGFPAPGRLVPLRLPAYLEKGTVVLEETLFYEPLNLETQSAVCQFLSTNLHTVANGDLLLWAAVGSDKLLVQVELQHDQLYSVEPNPNGKLNVYVCG